MRARARGRAGGRGARRAGRLRTVLALGALAALLGAAAPPAAAPDDPLDAALRRALAARALHGARVGALVVERTSGRVVFAHDAGRALVPASNQKVLTALAVLRAFGPARRFETRVLADAAPDADGTVGQLVVVGGGDPALTSEDWWRLAADLRRAGLRRVAGPLVLDDSAFDRERWHPAWGPVSARAYHAPVGALAANYGAFAVEVAPGAHVGAPARIGLDPPVPWLALVGRAHTAPAGAPRSLRVERIAGATGDRVEVSGRTPLGAEPKVFYRSVSDPTGYAGAVLRMQLAANGIEVAGATRRGAPPPGAVELLAFEGRSLAETVRLFLKYSNNTIAESLVKALGAHRSGVPGTWTSGMAALRAELEAAGLDLTGSTLVDGSGLARTNRVTPRLLVDALRIGRASFDFGPELVAALPIAAADGTLERRTQRSAGQVRAKTGLLDRVTALSGFAHRPDGRELVFSVIVNGYRVDDEAAMRAVDGFAHALVAPLAPRAARLQEPRDAEAVAAE